MSARIQKPDRLEQIQSGYQSAVDTLAGLASYEEHQVAREWLNSTHGMIAAKLAECSGGKLASPESEAAAVGALLQACGVMQ